MAEAPGQARLKATAYGLVQRVFFRDFIAQKARALGLRGYVQNLPDGRSIEMVAEGNQESLVALLQAFRGGPPRARVDQVEESWSEAIGGLPPFEVRR